MKALEPEDLVDGCDPSLGAHVVDSSYSFTAVSNLLLTLSS